MKDIKIDISSVGFPSQFVSDAEKATEEFGDILFALIGLKYSKFI